MTTPARLRVDLTGREADALHTLLYLVLNAPYLWSELDLAALGHVETKTTDALRLALHRQASQEPNVRHRKEI